jgi:hypothetical protein
MTNNRTLNTSQSKESNLISPLFHHDHPLRRLRQRTNQNLVPQRLESQVNKPLPLSKKNRMSNNFPTKSQVHPKPQKTTLQNHLPRIPLDCTDTPTSQYTTYNQTRWKYRLHRPRHRRFHHRHQYLRFLQNRRIPRQPIPRNTKSISVEEYSSTSSF